MAVNIVCQRLRRIQKHVSFKKVIICVEILLLIFCFCQYFRPLHSYLYEGNDLTCDYCKYIEYSDDLKSGCYVDASLVTDKTIDPKFLYITTPYVDLPAGSYQVAITYATDEEGQKYSVTSKFRTYSAVAGHERILLPVKENKVEFSFFSPIKVEEYQVHIDYSGSGCLFVESVSICETNTWKNLLLFYVVLGSILLNLIVFGYSRTPVKLRREARITLATIIALTIFTSTPILSYFMPGGDDLPFHLSRIEAIKTSFLTGQFPNRISSYWNNGYGYASAILYGELFLYIPALLRIIGFSVQGAYKFYILTVNLVTILISYYCFWKVFRNSRAALFGSAIYSLAPYRLVTIFLRGAVGEYTAMLFFPMIFYGLYRMYANESDDADFKRSWVPALLGYSGLIQSHTLSCVMVGIFSGLFCIVFIKKTLQPKRLLQLIKMGVGIVLLNMWYIVPFIDYFRWGYANSMNGSAPLGRFNSNGAFFSQMITFFQKGQYASRDIAEGYIFPDERNYAIGGFILVLSFYCLYRLYQGKNKSRISRIGDCSFGFAILSLFMCTLWFPWDFIQQMNGVFRMITRNIQHPWRFLGISSFLLTITAICLVILLQSLSNKYLYRGMIVITGLVFLLSADYFMYDYMQNVWWGRFISEDDIDSTAMGGREYLPANIPENFYEDRDAIPGEHLEIFVDKHELGTHTIECRNYSDIDTYVDVPFLPYEGYVCRDNQTGEKLEIQQGLPERIRVMVPGNYQGEFKVVFYGFWYWRIAEWISLATLISGIGCLLFNKLRRRNI